MSHEQVNTRHRAPKRLTLILGALLAAAVLLCAGASSASAVLIGLNESNNGETEANFEVIRRSGAHVYQQGFVWRRVADQGNWRQDPAWQQTYDKQVEYAARNQVNLVGGLYGRKTAAAEHQYYLSNEWQEWLEYVWTVVQRYGRNGAFWNAHPGLPYKPITSWSVWNEPNLAWNNPGETVLPQKYAEFLIATSNTITQAQNAIRKAGEPSDTRVIHGGLYQPDKGMFPPAFIEKASKVAGYGSSFTEMAAHPYSFSGNEAQKIAGLAVNVENIRTALNNWVSKSKPIWLNELGWPLPGGTGEPTVDEAEQAKLLTSSFNWVKAHAAEFNIELVSWYLYGDISGLGAWDGYCGLRDKDGKYRESWYAFQSQTGAPAWPSEATAFEANNGELWYYKALTGLGVPTGAGMAANTSPSIAFVPGSGYVVAFQDWHNELWIYTAATGTAFSTKLGMNANTSPSIAAKPDGSYVIAFQDWQKNLWIYSSATKGAFNTTLGMAANTSPSIVTKPDGSYAVAFEANNAELWYYPSSTGLGVPTGAGMNAKTSPSIAAKPDGSYVIAFQDWQKNLWIYSSATKGAFNTTLGMAANTSPSIVTKPDGSYAAAFEANNAELWYYPSSTGLGVPTKMGMNANTSPSIVVKPDGSYLITFQDWQKNLWRYISATGAGFNTTLGMLAGTSPSTVQ